MGYLSMFSNIKINIYHETMDTSLDDEMTLLSTTDQELGST